MGLLEIVRPEPLHKAAPLDIETLFREHHRQLVSFIRRRWRFDPEDIAQEVWLALMRRGPQAIRGNLWPYIRAAARNHIITAARNARRLRWSAIEDLTDWQLAKFRLVALHPGQISIVVRDICSPKTRAKMRAAWLRRRPCSFETRARISLAGRGRKRSAETRARMSKALRGRILSAETRRKLSLSHSGLTASPETRRKMSAAAHGHPVSPESRRKMSDSARHRRTRSA